MTTVKEIYDSLNLDYNCKEIFIEDFTSEQIYYQVEELVNKVVEKNENQICRYLKLCEEKNKKYSESVVKENKSESCIENEHNMKQGSDLENESTAKSDTDEEDLKNENTPESDTDEDDVENKSTIESDTVESEAHEETSSEFSFDKESEEAESEEINIDEFRNLPGSEIFKFLDKNIKK